VAAAGARKANGRQAEHCTARARFSRFGAPVPNAYGRCEVGILLGLELRGAEDVLYGSMKSDSGTC